MPRSRRDVDREFEEFLASIAHDPSALGPIDPDHRPNEDD